MEGRVTGGNRLGKDAQQLQRRLGVFPIIMGLKDVQTEQIFLQMKKFPPTPRIPQTCWIVETHRHTKSDKEIEVSLATLKFKAKGSVTGAVRVS